MPGRRSPTSSAWSWASTPCTARSCSAHRTTTMRPAAAWSTPSWSPTRYASADLPPPATEPFATRALRREDHLVSTPAAPHGDEPPTAGPEYARRLQTLSGARWKRVLDVQMPYRANLRRLHLGRTLDVGCGTGRNLAALDPGSVGVDHNPHSVEIAVKAGLPAVTIEQFLADADLTRPAGFDSMLVAHVVEHLQPDEARAVLASYLPMIRPAPRPAAGAPPRARPASSARSVKVTWVES